MDIYLLNNPKSKVAESYVVRGKDDTDARLQCVEHTEELEWVDDRLTTCKVLLCHGPRRILLGSKG